MRWAAGAFVARTRPASAELITATIRKTNQRQQLMRLGDGEGVERLDEEEIEREERQQGSIERWPDAEYDGREKHRQQKDHGQIGDGDHLLQRDRDEVAAATPSVEQMKAIDSSFRPATNGARFAGGAGVSALPVTKWMAMPSARRMRSCGRERCNRSAIKPPRERPMTISVTFSKREKRRISPDMSLPIRVLVSPPSASASLSAASRSGAAFRRRGRPAVRP